MSLVRGRGRGRGRSGVSRSRPQEAVSLARRATGFVWGAHEFDRRWNHDARFRAIDYRGRQYQLVSPLEDEVWGRSESDRTFMTRTLEKHGMPYIAGHGDGAGIGKGVILHLMYRQVQGTPHPFAIHQDEVSRGIVLHNADKMDDEPQVFAVDRLEVIPQSNNWKRCTGFLVVRAK